MHPQFLLHDLNPAQRAAVEATTGPVCILAGAGTGKTRVISRRVAYAIATDAVHPRHVLVVTFTEKAAGEMRGRLAQLGFPGVQAHTFHAAAWRQLRYFWSRLSTTPLPEVLESKAPLLVPLQRGLPGGYKFTAMKDLADEIEWAKARRIGPDGYQEAVERAGRPTPLPPDLFSGLFRRYERARERARRIDFEDMLARMLDGLESDQDVAEEFRGQYRWFSVDEYQDTNPLQQALLEAWLGERRDLAVVGDEDQTIYTFTGASSEYLTGFTRRFPDAQVLQLEQNYRSTPQVLAVANRLLARSGRRRSKRLVATREPGPEPVVVAFESAGAEAAALVAEARRLADLGVALEEIGVLVRTNAQIPPIEEALADAGIRYQVRGELFFRRPEVRQALRLLRSRADRAAGGGLVDAVEAIWFERMGFRREADPDGEEARQRHASLVTLLGIAERLREADERADLAAFLADVERRAADEVDGVGGGVNLLTYHRAKGLEFDAVLLPALEEGLLPVRQASTTDQVAEERRLLYVGLTRARVHLWLAWAARRAGPSGREQPRKPSRFLDDLVLPGERARPRAVAAAMGRPAGTASAAGTAGNGARALSSPLAERLRAWRRERARQDGVPPYVVFNDRTLAALAERCPRSRGELLAVEGIGPTKLDRYGEELLGLLDGDGNGNGVRGAAGGEHGVRGPSGGEP
jgi:DNA helicase-2/ATP-dependent DNA helicase PcrA